MLLYNFLFGYITYYINVLNYKMIKDEAKILKVIITMLFAFNMSIIYILGVYKLCNGIYHIYYLLLYFIGYYVSYKLRNHVKILSKKIKSIDFKIFKR